MRPADKYAWMVKVGERGQIVIPKEARELFHIEAGDNLLLLGDVEKGLAIVRKEDMAAFMEKVFA